jgi:hypothetical protein
LDDERADRPIFEMDGRFSLEPLLSRYGARRSRMEPMYEEMLAVAQQLAQPLVLRETFPASQLPTLAVHLPGAEKIVLGISTLGHKIEDHVGALFADEPGKAVILDEIANAWVGGLARQLHLTVRAEAREQGLHAGPAFRPGIGHWPVALQADVVRALDAAQAGITLMESMMMSPEKSISSIIALGHRLGRSIP